MAELANAFIRPAGADSFEVLDPSVIDLVNAVVRRAPEIAVDMIFGAVDFSQIERVWKMGGSGIQGVRQPSFKAVEPLSPPSMTP